MKPRIQKITIVLELGPDDEDYSPVRPDGYTELENFFTDINYVVKSISTETL